MDARIHDVGKFFHSSVCLVVPVYQRPYVWSRANQWEPLWSDIRRLAEQVLNTGTTKPHFMGAVVVDLAPGFTGSYVHRSMVVDGQQRMTTIQIFLEALADNYECLRDEGCESARLYADRARMITRNQLLADNQPGDEFKVWPMNLDQSAFHAVMTVGSPAQLHERHSGDSQVIDSRIASAYLYFYERIEEWLDHQEDRDKAIAALYDVVDRYMQIVVIDLQNSVDPQVIFETLNARGTPLAPSDLIKNFLFHQAQIKSGDGDDLYAQYWQPFEDSYDYWSRVTGRGNQARPRLDAFMHQYLTMQARDEISVKRLYQEFRDFADSTDMDIIEQLQELKRYGEVYRHMDELEPYGREAIFIQRIRAMDTATIMPFVLALMGDKTMSPEDRIEIMGYLESFLVRRMICRLSGKAYNKIFVELLQAADEQGMTPEVIKSTLLGWTDETNRWPDDTEFLAGWMNNRAYDMVNARIRMVFAALEPVVATEKTEDIAYIQDKLSIEHLLPQNWHAYYPLPEDGSSTEIDREGILHTFGNLTLLRQKLNSSVSNGPWSTADDLADDRGKRSEILKHSALAINRMLSSQRVWDEKTIKERGQLLFRAALKVWPRPESPRVASEPKSMD